MLQNGYEICDKCNSENAENEVEGKNKNSYQLCDDCLNKLLTITDEFVEEG